MLRAVADVRVRWSIWHWIVLVCAALASFAVLWAGGPGALFVSLAMLAVVTLTAAYAAEREDLRFLMVAGCLALFSREILSAAIELWVRGRGAVVFTSDEDFYISVGSAYARAWLGATVDPASFNADAGGIYPIFVGVIFWMFGPNVMVVKLINSALAVLTALLVYRTMRNLALPGARAAFLVLLVFPSFVLWSVLALKDTAVVFLSAGVIWTVSEFVRSKRYVWHLATVVALVALELVRQYVFVALAFGWLAAVVSLPRPYRWRAAIAIGSSVLILFVALRPFAAYGENPLVALITSREAVAQTGRTSFVEPKPVAQGDVGDSFVVSVAGATSVPGRSPEVHLVRPGTELVVDVSSSAPGAAGAPTLAPGVVAVRPGDIVTIVDATATSTPASAVPSPTNQAATPTVPPPLIPLVIQPERRNVIATSPPTDVDGTTLGGSITVNLRQLPVGAWHVLAAPFPWSARTIPDLLAIPEMLLWYAIVVAGLFGLAAMWRTRSLAYVAGIASLVLMFGELSLIEANVGTLLRHRSMLLPYAAVLSGVGLSRVVSPQRIQSIFMRFRRRIEVTPMELGTGLAASAVAVFTQSVVMVPIPLYVQPLCSSTTCFSNVPSVSVLPLMAGIAVVLMVGRTLTPKLVAYGLVLGGLLTLVAALPRVVAFELTQPYFTTPYRAYAVIYLIGVVGGLIAVGLPLAWRNGNVGRLFGISILGTVLLAASAALARGEVVVAGATLVAPLLGFSVIVAGLVNRVRSHITAPRILMGIMFIGFVLRVLYGLQTLSRTGPGMAFALDSDDGPSYYGYASLLYADPSALPVVLGANAGFPPLYSLFLAAIFGATRESLAAVIVVQAALAAVSTYLLFKIGRDAVSLPVGLVAAALFATNKNIVQNQATLTAEAILVPLILLALYSLFRYRRSAHFGWLVACAFSIAGIFVTRNVVVIILPVALVWLWLVRTRRFFARDFAVLVATVVLVALPIGLVTLQTEGRMRFTNQLAGVTYELIGGGGTTIENEFLLDRGINPFSDPLGSVERIIRDPLPVMGFFTEAVPQRLSYLLFSSSPGASDPVLVMNPGLFPNSYGELIVVTLALATLVAPVVLLLRRRHSTPEILLLGLYVLAYLAVFAFVFPPRQAFRYRIPIEPVVFLAQAGVMAIAVRWLTASQAPRV